MEVAFLGWLLHRQQPPVAEHDVDLAREEVGVGQLAVVDGDVEVVGVVVQLRALPRRAEVLEDELVDARPRASSSPGRGSSQSNQRSACSASTSACSGSTSVGVADPDS
jgi:hypothetical protein